MMFRILNLILIVACGFCTHADDWRQFRGNSANSIASNETLPTELSGGNIAWKIALPGRGTSGPIAVGEQIILTACSGYEQDRLHIISCDSDTGEIQWDRKFEATGRTVCHEKMSVATPTPASDGERIFAFYSSNDLICTDLAGHLLWYRGLGSENPNASNSLGMSSSPIVVGATVIAQVESDAESFAVGVDTQSGQTKWKIDRPRQSNWTSPTILPASEKSPALALLQSSKGITAVDPENGKIVWEFAKGASTIPSASVVDGRVYVPSNGLTTLDLNDQGYTQAWNAARLAPSTSSPVVIDGLTITVNRTGAIAAGDIQTGKRLWQHRLKGPFSATPVVSNGHLYFFNESGTVFVVKATPDGGETVSQFDLADTILGSPAVSQNALYIRSDGQLWKIAQGY